MARIHFNNFSTRLSGAITDVATSVTFDDSIPALGSGNTANFTIFGGGNYEIIKISSNAGAPTYTVDRGEEGTTARAWDSGALVECRVTRDSIDTKEETIDGRSISTVTLTSTDKILLQDASDSDNLKVAQASDVAGFSALTFISAQTASNSTSLDFTDLGDYSSVLFVLNDIRPATDNTRLHLRTSTDNGSTYDSSAGNYQYAFFGTTASATSAGNTGSTSATEIHLGSGVGNDTGELLNGIVNLFNPASAKYKYITFDTSVLGATTILSRICGSGVRATEADVDAVRFLFATGNVDSGTIYAYGVKKS